MNRGKWHPSNGNVKIAKKRRDFCGYRLLNGNGTRRLCGGGGGGGGHWHPHSAFRIPDIDFVSSRMNFEKKKEFEKKAKKKKNDC